VLSEFTKDVQFGHLLNEIVTQMMILRPETDRLQS